MARTNTKAAPSSRPLTYEGTPAKRLTDVQALRRAVMSCLLWENTFYETGNKIADTIRDLVLKVEPIQAANIAREARELFKLRHVPLFIARTLAGFTPAHKAVVADLLCDVIQRPDELAEFMAIYWKGRKPGQPKKIAMCVKKGLARAFVKFNAFQLAKYNRDAEIKLRDVMFLVCPKPKNEEQAVAFKQLASNTLPTPDTWETELSAGKDKAATFTRLIGEKKLGAMAMLRNLRNMQEAKVGDAVIRQGLNSMNTERVLPFRFVAAARFAPAYEPELEQAMYRCVEGQPKLMGRTALVVDTSPSMWQDKISKKSDMTRFDAAAALAVLCREVCDNVAVYAFNEKAYDVPARRGFALRDSLAQTRGNASCGGAAVLRANEKGYDRIIVLTDGEWHETDPKTGTWKRNGMGAPAGTVIPAPLTDKAYLINVASYTNAIGTNKWVMIDGWSEALLDYILAHEAAPLG